MKVEKVEMCSWCNEKLRDDQKITYIKNVFAQSHRAKKYHDICFDEMSN